MGGYFIGNFVGNFIAKMAIFNADTGFVAPNLNIGNMAKIKLFAIKV